MDGSCQVFASPPAVTVDSTGGQSRLQSTLVALLNGGEDKFEMNLFVEPWRWTCQRKRRPRPSVYRGSFTEVEMRGR